MLDDASLAFGLFNAGKETAAVTANSSNSKPKGSQRVRYFWQQKDIGVFTDKFESTLASHGAVPFEFLVCTAPCGGKSCISDFRA